MIPIIFKTFMVFVSYNANIKDNDNYPNIIFLEGRNGKTLWLWHEFNIFA